MKSKVQYEADFKYGSSENIIFKAVTTQQGKYTERLSNDPRSNACKRPATRTLPEGLLQMGSRHTHLITL
ncbi:hypothetical protein HF086_004547 [Spodoptera exigua]|uniref:Uncharacterized protein n=1 Tax=Spodoptera exigua TaxID=7107 RepID=A0A922SEM8_SPOEX|nr:hypothetical protein HF086_004547 [Spodoptera exigua]